MNQPTFTAWVCLSVVLATTTAVFADSWTCRNADLTRQVLVFYPEAPARLPCSVFYSKPRESVVPRPLWQANNTEGYCERKAAGFVARLESMGWRCTLDAPEPATSSAPGPVPAARPE